MKVSEFLASGFPPTAAAFQSISKTGAATEKRNTLSSEVEALMRQKSQFVTRDKIQLNFRKVGAIDALPPSLLGVSKLYLANNELSSLAGIEQFSSLTHLSIAHNFLFSLQELEHLRAPQLLQSLSVKGNFFTRHPNYKALIIQFFPNLVDLDNVTVTDQMVQNIKDGALLRRQLIPFFLRLRRLSDRFEDFVHKMKVRCLLSQMKLELKERAKQVVTEDEMRHFAQIQEHFKSVTAQLKNPIFKKKQPYLAPRQLLRIIESMSLEQQDYLGQDVVEIPKSRATKQEFKDIYKWLFSEIVLNLSMTRQNELTNFLNYLILCQDPTLFRLLLEKVLGSLDKQNRECASQLHSHSGLLNEPKRRSELLQGALRLMLTAPYIDTERLFAEQIKQFYLLQPNQSRVVDSFILLEEQDSEIKKLKKEVLEQEEEDEAEQEEKVEDFEQKYIDIRTNDEYIHDYGAGSKHPFRPRDRGPYEITGGAQEYLPPACPEPPRLYLEPYVAASEQNGIKASANESQQEHPLIVTLGSGEVIAEAPADAEVSALMGGPSVETAASLFHSSPYRNLGGSVHESTKYDGDFLDEQLLYEFPVFSLNHEYLRAILKILHIQLERIAEIFREKNAILFNLDLLPRSSLISRSRSRQPPLYEVHEEKSIKFAPLPLTTPTLLQPSISTDRGSTERGCKKSGRSMGTSRHQPFTSLSTNMPLESPHLGRRAATRCLERSLLRYVQKVAFEAIRFHNSEFLQLRYNLNAFLRCRRSRTTLRVFRGFKQYIEGVRERRCTAWIEFREKSLIERSWEGFMELWDLVQRRNRTVARFANRYRAFKTLKGLGEYVRVKKEKESLKAGVLEYCAKMKRRTLFKKWRLLYLLHLKAKLMRYQARALDSERASLKTPLPPRVPEFKDTASTMKIASISEPESHNSRFSLQQHHSRHHQHHQSASTTTFRVKYSDYCRCADCVRKKVDIIPEFDSVPHIAHGGTDELSQRVERISHSLLRKPNHSVSQQSAALSESPELSPPKRVTFKVSMDSSGPAGEAGKLGRLTQKRGSNATGSTAMPSQREGRTPRSASGRGSPPRAKRATIKTTGAKTNKNATTNTKTKKFYYQRSYEELRSRSRSPYAQKTVSFMAKQG